MGDITYHDYQQILDLGGEDQVLKQRRARRKFKKSTNGCLSCKQKRKKCDEIKPNCTTCVRRGITCVWPDKVNRGTSTRHDNTTTDFVDVSKIPTVNENQNGDPMQHDGSLNNQQEQQDNQIFDLSFTDDPLLYEFLHLQSVIKEEDNESVESCRSSSSSSAPRIYDEFEHTLPGIQLTREEAKCYDAFVSTFLPSITPAHCDPLLSPMTILLPYALTSVTVREIFLACGATQLAYSDDEFKGKSYQRYVKVVGLLVSDIQQSADGCEDHLFIAVQLLQTLCLRDKSLGLNATKSAGHLAAAYEIIKKRFLKSATTYSSSSSSASGLQFSSLDRILTEHFIFNFPITLILCRHDKLSKVPSPFHFFEQFGGMLTRPSRPNATSPKDEWRNHPILGVSLKAHEICTKCTWLVRTQTLPLSSQDMLRALDLREQTMSELARLTGLINEELTSNPQKQSIAYAKAKLYGASIVLRKLLNPALLITDDEIQSDVLLMIDEMKYSRALDKEHLLSMWAMFICGSVAIKQEHRDFIQQGFETVSSSIRSSLAQKVLRYLNIVWEEEDPVGLVFLFDTTVLDIVCT
ncbi:CYFA0S09e04104g1_1 [Cyberlindnera fabianii]|uniref:CYFA0S09e04104g1_1 n=1 Tax=Cyberlindnera fabianii TaxID=36022 RepID=A0A061AZ16_CYBFA|nr:CYFA0S09e04104g1_1 [Cyberlindnera fabianii]